MQPLVSQRTYPFAFNPRVRADQEIDTHSSFEDTPQRTILFVDDEPSILALRRFVFEALGYLVLTAASGPEALDLLHAHAVDAVVLDYLMCPMDGEEIARIIRQEYGKIPVVLSSGCLSLPQSLLDIVDVSIAKGGPPGRLIEVLKHLFTLRVSRLR